MEVASLDLLDNMVDIVDSNKTANIEVDIVDQNHSKLDFSNKLIDIFINIILNKIYLYIQS